jgi:outer membrane protein TolC
MTVEDVVQATIATHPRLAAVRARAASARSLASSAGDRMLPTVVLSDEYQRYDSPFALSFPIPSATPIPPITAREQTTNSFVAGINQPVVGLLRRSEDYKSEGSSADAAAQGTLVAESATREAVEIEYLRMFESGALEEIAKASEAELADQVNVTVARVKAGTQTNADLLRVKVAAANARQQAIAARAQATVSRVNVLSAIGAPPDDHSIEFAEPTSLLTRAAPTAVTDPQRARPEVRQAELAAEAARHQARAKLYALLPEVDLEAAYLRVDGQVFAPANSAFVGVKASWPIWEWGASAAAHRAAAAQADAAQDDVATTRRQVQVEVAQRGAELDAAEGAVTVAEQTIASAEEAYRVTDALVRAGSATTTDLLDSQAALTQARLNTTRAKYELAIAQVRLTRATGAN